MEKRFDASGGDTVVHCTDGVTMEYARYIILGVCGIIAFALTMTVCYLAMGVEAAWVTYGYLAVGSTLPLLGFLLSKAH